MASVERIQQLLGGEAVTGSLHSERDIDRLVRRGVPTEAVERFLATSHLNFNLIESHVVARRTSLAMLAPRVAVPRESNVLLNVRHAAMADVRVISNDPFRFDRRPIELLAR